MPPSSVVMQAARDAYAGGHLIIFAGAGIGVDAGLPSWLKLAQKVRARLVSEARPADDVAEVDALIARGKLIDALSAAKRSLGDHEFNLMVEDACDDQRVTTLPETVQAIAELEPHLKAVLTTNLDRLLERAFGGRWPTFTTPTGNLAQRRHYILKLHGTVDDRNTWVFTREQYDQVSFGRPQYRDVLEALFRGYQILFVGFGLEDDDLDLTLGAVRALSGANPPAHFALVKGPIAPFRRTQLESTGIRLLVYDEHAAVPGLLRALP